MCTNVSRYTNEYFVTLTTWVTCKLYAKMRNKNVGIYISGAMCTGILILRYEYFIILVDEKTDSLDLHWYI